MSRSRPNPAADPYLSTPLPKVRPLALAVHLIVFGGAFALAAHAPEAFAQSTPQATATRAYDIPAGPLSSALVRFAREAGVALVGAGNAAEGKSSPGLKGSHTVQGGFAALLAGSGLEAFRQGDGSYGLRLAPLQGGSREVFLAPVTVSAQVERDGTTEGSRSYAARATSIGKGDAKSLREIPQSVSVVTHQQIEDQKLTTVAEALVQAPGLSINGIRNELPVFESRGYSMEMSYEGMGISGGLSSNGLRSYMDDLSAIDRVEVLRGPAGLLRASNASPGFGGMVNIVRKKPKKDFSLSGEITAGSWNNYRGAVDIAGSLNNTGTVRGRAVASLQDRDFFYNEANQKGHTLYSAIEADLASNTLLSLSLSHQKLDKHGKSAAIPRYGDGRLLSTDRSTSIGEGWRRQDRTTNDISAELQHFFENEWKLKAKVYYTKEKYDERNLVLESGVSALNTGTFNAVEYDRDVKHTGYDLSIAGPINLFGNTHQLVVGIDGGGYDDKFDYYTASFSNKNVYNPGISYPFDSQPDHYRFEFSQESAYASAHIQAIDDLKLILGARSLLKLRYKVRTGVSSDVDIANEISPYGGLIWDVSKDISLYASYAEQFIPQTTFSTTGLLPPQVGWQGEAGIKGEFFDKRLNGSLAFYRIQDTNRPLASEGTGCNNMGGQCYTASGKVQSQGVDIELNGSPFRGMQLMFGYTYNENKYLKDTGVNQGQQFNGLTPRHLFKLWGTYQFAEQKWGAVFNKLTAGAGIMAQSDIYVRNVKQSGYSVANAFLKYQIDPKTSLTLNIDNLFDRHYLTAIQALPTRSTFNYYGAPQAFQLTLRASF